jgi:hypothetical protein
VGKGLSGRGRGLRGRERGERRSAACLWLLCTHRLIEAGNDSCVIYRQSEARLRPCSPALSSAHMNVTSTAACRCDRTWQCAWLARQAGSARLAGRPAPLSACAAHCAVPLPCVCLLRVATGFCSVATGFGLVATVSHGSCCIARRGLRRRRRRGCASSAPSRRRRASRSSGSPSTTRPRGARP